jgi:hypothetical protein
MTFRLVSLIGIGAVLAGLAFAQESDSGISLPVTLSAGTLYSGRLQLVDPTAAPASAGLRTVFYPTVKLGSHWFGYAAVQVRYAPYFYYDAYNPNHELFTDVLQAYAGYSFRAADTTVVIKAGRLTSAFGSFPLRYDDAENPLLDQPLSYIQSLTLRADQLPCGTVDLLNQFYGSVAHQCGGVAGRTIGITPVTLYGLPAVQVEASGHRMDVRLQASSGSPASPQAWTRAGTYRQWTAGAGFTIRQGFRVGVSGFRGPYLDPSLASLLPPGTTVRDFPASGIGTDVQWARGRWSVNGEWQRFHFESPNFSVSPSLESSYVEGKTRLTPRLFVAGRVAWLRPGRVVDKSGVSATEFASSMGSYELGGGWWLNRHQLLKASYQWLNIEYVPGAQLNVYGVQLVTTFNTFNHVFQ